MNLFFQADEAYGIGPPTAGESYLRQDKILDVAKQSGTHVRRYKALFFRLKKNNSIKIDTKWQCMSTFVNDTTLLTVTLSSSY